MTLACHRHPLTSSALFLHIHIPSFEVRQAKFAHSRRLIDDHRLRNDGRQKNGPEYYQKFHEISLRCTHIFKRDDAMQKLVHALSRTGALTRPSGHGSVTA